MKNLFNPEDKAEIIRRVNEVKGDSEKLWGKMNVEQMIVHVKDQLLLALGEREFTLQGPKIFKSLIGQKLALYVVPWRKGKEETPSEMNMEIGGSKTTTLQNDKRELLARIEIFSKTPTANLFAHPFFGKLRNKDWGRLAYKHLDHHLKQFSN